MSRRVARARREALEAFGHQSLSDVMAKRGDGAARRGRRPAGEPGPAPAVSQQRRLRRAREEALASFGGASLDGVLQSPSPSGGRGGRAGGSRGASASPVPVHPHEHLHHEYHRRRSSAARSSSSPVPAYPHERRRRGRERASASEFGGSLADVFPPAQARTRGRASRSSAGSARTPSSAGSSLPRLRQSPSPSPLAVPSFEQLLLLDDVEVGLDAEHYVLFTRKATPLDLPATCSICLDDVRRNQTVQELPCKHLFHNTCILPWWAKNKKCPNCRADCGAD